VSPATTLDRLAILSGFAGSLAVTAGSVLTALAYNGSNGESFSPLNHFVSELGELFVSDLAPVFNTSLIIGGVAFAVFMIGLASARAGRLRWVYGVLGVVAGAAGALVGVLPMNYLDQHAVVALTFFNLGLVVRLDFWPLTTFEWLLIAGILLWAFLTSTTWWRAIRRGGE
jgi:hypothetical membrane protein